MLTTLFEEVRSADWGDPNAVTVAADKLLRALDEHRDHLSLLVASAAANPALLRLCEHNDILDKLVLHDDPTGWRLHLHVFAPGYFDQPHNHRWTYSSRILAGCYVHTLYGADDQLGDGVDVASLRPRMVRTERAGDSYTLHHSMIHSVVAAPYTTSLIVRGPAVTDRFLVTDLVTGDAWWQDGAAVEDPVEAARNRMTAEQLHACLDRLIQVGVLP